MTASVDSTPRPVRAGGAAFGSLRPPPSKSLTQRYFNLALLATTPSEVKRPLLAEDTEAYLAGLAGMGCGVERCRGGVRLTPPAAPGEARIDCGAGGTMLRFLTAAACVVPGVWRLDGTERLRRRPLAPLIAALRGLGGRIDCFGEEGHAPLRVSGDGLDGGRVDLDAGESSQYLSALLMAATRARGAVEVSVGRLTSAPYVELTLAALAALGVAVERPTDELYRLQPAPIAGREVAVEADASAACYPGAAAALTGGRVAILGLAPDSRQGDLGFFELLRRMGADVAWQGGRLAAMRRELERLGAKVAETADGLEIPGVWADAAPPSAPVTVSSHDDHRIAMSLALVGLRRPGLTVAAPEVVAKSYPAFWQDFERLLV